MKSCIWKVYLKEIEEENKTQSRECDIKIGRTKGVKENLPNSGEINPKLINLIDSEKGLNRNTCPSFLKLKENPELFLNLNNAISFNSVKLNESIGSDHEYQLYNEELNNRNSNLKENLRGPFQTLANSLGFYKTSLKIDYKINKRAFWLK